MRKDLLPAFFYGLSFRGFEPDDDDDKGKEGNNSETDDTDDEDDDSEDKNKGQGENTDALKSALRKERNERKRLDKEAKELRKFKEEAEGKEKSESDNAKEAASKAESKALKLAAALQKTAVDNAIIKLGGKLKFRDIDDALSLVTRDSIDVEQDDDDPSDIEIDESTVEAALKDLAKRKPHLIIAEGQEDKSGSKFGGGRKSQQDMDDEAARKRFPALGAMPSNS